jgi:hypothetical protein
VTTPVTANLATHHHHAAHRHRHAIAIFPFAIAIQVPRPEPCRIHSERIDAIERSGIGRSSAIDHSMRHGKRR